MNDKELLDYFTEHENRIKKELHRFLWNNARYDFQIDLYFYPDTKEFYAFTNIGGNSWLNDNHITIYHINRENIDIERGCFREYVNEMTEIVYDQIIYNFEEQVKQDEYYSE